MDLAIRPVPSGWDNRLWRLGDELAVRLPMTERAPALLSKEFRWFPELAKRLPLPVPTPQYLGAPTPRFPRPWVIATLVPGEPADGAEISNVRQTVDSLAHFLRALHQPAPDDAPTNPGRSVPLGKLAEVFESRLDAVADAVDVRRVRQVWSGAIAATCWTSPAVWIHADLHPANALISDGTISGIVDFVDLCAGDPAADLAAAWKLLPQGAAADLLNAYGVTMERRFTAPEAGPCCQRLTSSPSVGRGSEVFQAGSRRGAASAAASLSMSSPSRSAWRLRQLVSRRERMGGVPRMGPVRYTGPERLTVISRPE
ncbi:aminoglycoside phosphotransferase family protein [Streptomyces variegatus]|uniref:aminoglycoside phosphotransferase family protein n=1 Tax=Streptomyces variegatus TaxID=284040 RepID=UPI003C2EE9A6